MINTDFSALAFADVKNSLINHYKNSANFADYDFEGSRMNTLIDGLAYAALYQGTMANAALFESFLQSARNRGSVVMGAQNIGYVPASTRGATIDMGITLTYNQPGALPNSAKVPFGFKFSGTMGDTKYDFVTFKDTFITKNTSGTYTGDLNVIQGKIIRQQYTWAANTRIFIRDTTIDRRYIRIQVDGVDYTLAGNAARTGSTDTVYYFRETQDGWTEIYFGAGELEVIPGQPDLSSYVGGITPAVGQTVVIQYLSVKGSDGNGITTFKAVDSVAGFDFAITLSSDAVSDGGGDKENIERIRTVAPKVFEAQGRCVTAQDYEAFVLQQFGSVVQAIRCFGDNTKPGYAFIAIKPVNELVMNSAEMQAIEDYLSDYNVVTIAPLIVTPDYIFIEQTISVDYRVTELSVSEDQLITNIKAQVEAYFAQNITTFSASFHTSKLLGYIDNTDTSVLGSRCSIRLVKELEDNYLTPTTGVNFLNPLVSKSFISSPISFIQDPANPYNLNILSTDSGGLVIGPFKANSGITQQAYGSNDFNRVGTAPDNQYFWIGTIDHPSGAVYFNLGALGLPRSSFAVANLQMYASPVETDIYTKNGSLIVYEPLLRPSYISVAIHPIL